MRVLYSIIYINEIIYIMVDKLFQTHVYYIRVLYSIRYINGIIYNCRKIIPCVIYKGIIYNLRPRTCRKYVKNITYNGG